MALYSEKIKAKVLPLVTIGDTVLFPAIPANIEISDARAIAACEAARESDSNIFALTLLHGSDISDVIGKVGVIAKIKSISHSTPGSAVISLEGICRADFIDIKKQDSSLVWVT